MMALLINLLGSDVDNDTVASWHSLSVHSGGLHEAWKKLGGEFLIGKEDLKRVLPVGDQLCDLSEQISIMGILNLTPDSFSHGGMSQSVEAAISRVRSMIMKGADIIDLGAQSTRPLAALISPQEELKCSLPVLEAVLEMPEMEGELVSVDTFYPEVAREAAKKGTHIVKHVSAGKLDGQMFKTVAELKVPYIAMRMRQTLLRSRMKKICSTRMAARRSHQNYTRELRKRKSQAYQLGE